MKQLSLLFIVLVNLYCISGSPYHIKTYSLIDKLGIPYIDGYDNKCHMTYYVELSDSNSSLTIDSSNPVSNSIFRENGVYTFIFDINYVNVPAPNMSITFYNSVLESIQVDVEMLMCLDYPQTPTPYIFTPPLNYKVMSFSKLFHYYIDFGSVYMPSPKVSCVTNNSAFICTTAVSGYHDRGYHFLGMLYSMPFSSNYKIFEPVQANMTIGAITYPFTTSPVYSNTTVSPVTQVVSGQYYPPPNTPLYGDYLQYYPFTGLYELTNVNPDQLAENPFYSVLVVSGSRDQGKVQTFFTFPSSGYTASVYLVQNGNTSQLYSDSPGYIVINSFNPSNGSITFNTSNANIVVGQISLSIDNNILYRQLVLSYETLDVITLPYPFGYSRDTYNTTLKYKVSTFLPAGSSQFSYKVKVNTASYNQQVNSNGTAYPVLNTIEFFPASSGSYLIKMNISSPYPGLSIIKFRDTIATSALYQGDTYNGLYMFEYVWKPLMVFAYSTPKIELWSNNGQVKIYDTIYHTSTFVPLPIISDKFNIYSTNFTKFKFVPNIIDTSYGSVNVSLYFALVNPDNNWKPILTYYFKESLTVDESVLLTTECYYSNYDEMHRCDFSVPQYVGNITLSYYIGTQSVNQDYRNYFGDEGSLYIYSNYIDILPPLIVDIKSLTSPIVNVDPTNGATIGFELVVEDYPSGLKYGELNITSDYDLHPRTFKFNQSTLVNSTTGTYRFEFPVNGKCRNQTFSISGMKLIDNGGWISQYPITSDIQRVSCTFNPMMKVMYNNTFQSNITIICDDLKDSIPPVIVDFSCNTTSIEFATNVNGIPIEFNLTISDNLELSDRHYPTVYLLDNAGNGVAFNPIQTNRFNSTLAQYSYSGVIPYRYGLQGLIISVYGLVDSNLNIGGYTSLELQSLGFPYFIDTIVDWSKVVPLIASSNGIYENTSSQITLRGNGFGESTTAFIDYGQGFEPTQVVYVKEVIAVITVNATNQPFVLVKLGNSNSFKIPVRKIPRSVINPPVIPISCPSTCQEGGRGNCTVNGCVCNSPWFGPTCSDKNIPVPDPVVNPNAPVIVITPPDNQTSVDESAIYSVISIYSVRELDLNGEMIAEYKFKNWTLHNQTASTDTNYKYLYTAKLNQTETQLNVTIQWFREQSNITFANQIDIIAPNTLKFSMDIDHYNFTSVLNSLQVVMEVGVVPQTSFCTQSKSSGKDSNNNVQWLKLQVDDKSLYGLFNRRGVVDGRVITVINTIVHSNEQTVLVGTNVPYYVRDIHLDPNFSTLIDTNPDAADKGKCDNESKSDKRGMIAGIVVGGAVALALAIGGVIYYKKRVKENNSNKSLQEKLQRLSKTH